MTNRKMLFVDDDKKLCRDMVRVLERRGWTVETAGNGQEALSVARERGSAYDVIVLDLKMPELGGEEVLEHIQDDALEVAPIIVLSAYIDHALEQKCRYLGAAHVLKKPFDPKQLAEVASALAAAGRIGTSGVDVDGPLLDYMVDRRKKALRDLLVATARAEASLGPFKEPVFVVGRRWNSWYPSVFPVPGGAYAIVGPPQSRRPKGTERDATPAAVIDPGFRFLEVFREIGVPCSELECCVITHNHPDHIGGVFELMASRHALREKTRALCSPSCREMLGNCSGFNFEVKELDEKLADLFPPYETEGRWLRVRLKSFDTAHEEIGRANSSKGLCMSVERGATVGALEPTAEVALLGDTEYERGEHRDTLMPILCKRDAKIAVLHIGCSQFRQATGKHLYLGGLRSILSDMDSELDKTHHKGRLLVLVSEWGLEHATREQISRVCHRRLPGFNDFSPMAETTRCLQKDLRKILLMPADIGLVVGAESGMVYKGDSDPVPPEDIDVQVTENGLSYERRPA